MAAANFGVNRREATYASVVLTITGEAGAEVLWGHVLKQATLYSRQLRKRRLTLQGQKTLNLRLSTRAQAEMSPRGL